MSDLTERYIRQQAELYGEHLPKEFADLVNLERVDEEATIEVKAKNLQFTMPIKEVPKAISRQEVKVVETPQVKAASSEYNFNSVQSFEELNDLVNTCMACALGPCRKNFVFGKGNPNAKILIVGEAPGQEEDLRGKPFVGPAGQLLDRILSAVNLSDENVFITNIVKCRPPNNRDPESVEIAACAGILERQISLMQPKLILALGRVSGRTLLNSTLPLSKMRAEFHNYNGIPLMVTYHPSALLRNEGWKRPTWEDIQKFRKKYDELR